jgi:excinuclease ABC subunit A
MENAIVVRGARVHNLKDLDVEIPLDRLTVVTGVSGSGKSSLVFDTIYAEGERRYVESLSAYARQFLGQMEKPDVDSIEGLSPAISVEQRTAGRNPRSTVGTVTEIYDYLRVLFSRAGTPHCPKCGAEIASMPVDGIVERILGLPEGTAVQLLAPLARERKGSHRELLADLSRRGFTRVRIDGQVQTLGEVQELAKTRAHTLEVVVDRLVVRAGLRGRVTDSVETALREGLGLVTVLTATGETPYSARMACPTCGLALPELHPRIFSFNSPLGACPSCDGLGRRLEFDPDRVIPGKSLTAAEQPAPKTPDWPMRLATSSIQFKTLPIEQTVEQIAKLGFEAIDIWSGHAGCPHLDDVAKRLGPAGLKELLAKHSLKLYSFSVMEGLKPLAELPGSQEMLPPDVAGASRHPAMSAFSVLTRHNACV